MNEFVDRFGCDACAIRIFWYALSVKGCKKLTSVNLQAYESIRR